MGHKRKRPEFELIESFAKTYFTFVEFIENQNKSGYIAVLCRVKPEAKELIRAKLMDSWVRADRDLMKIKHRLEKIMGFDEDLPDEIKK